MIFHYGFAKKPRIPPALRKIMVNRPMPDNAGGVIAPVLRSLRGKNRMLYRKNEIASGRQITIYLHTNILKRSYIMQCQRADNDIERAVRKRNILDRRMEIVYIDGGVFPAGAFQHLLRKVHPRNAGSAVFCSIGAMPAEAAA